AAAAELQQRISSKAVLRLASDSGLHDLPDGPSLALGTGVGTPLGLTAPFSIFSSGGAHSTPRGLPSGSHGGGDEVFTQPAETRTVISPQVAFQMVSMLRDVVDRGTGSPARALGVRGAVGGKTGTTDDYRDAWFVGFSSSIVAGVWVGFDQPATIAREAYAARVALPIWADFMKRIQTTMPPAEFEVPPGVEARELCSVSYMRPVSSCPTYTEYFKEGDPVPADHCDVHQGSLSEQAQRVVGG